MFFARQSVDGSSSSNIEAGTLNANMAACFTETVVCSVLKKNQKTDALKVNMAAYQVLIFVINIKKVAEHFQHDILSSWSSRKVLLRRMYLNVNRTVAEADLTDPG